jgi:asparagine synthase (glutamine-hydrolysing)
MLGAIGHRGPDDEGVWSEGGACLGHRRLSIIDLSAAGHQPMISSCGRYVLTFGGEIYNFASLRGEVEAARPIAWRGHSDTEVFLETIARLGIERALERAYGMFAFALWDRQEHTAYLARDRFGEKPLYYSTHGGGLIFASELTAMERAPGLPRELAGDALSLFFRYGYIPAPFSIYQAVSKLPPGCLLTWREGAKLDIATYFSVARLIEAGRADRLGDPNLAVEALDRLLREAVGEQMVADVPLGAFLSGGVDSSLVVAIMQAVGKQPVRTFTMGFESPEFDEAPYALAVARHLGTDHTEHYVTQSDAQAIVPRLGELFDEPFADASQIPTFMISQMARRDVTVCLTGDGGDEMFGGYVRYVGAPRLWDAIRGLPLRGLASRALTALPLGLVNRGMSFLGPLARQYTARGALAPSLRRAAGWLAARDRDDLYERTMTAWSRPDRLLTQPSSTERTWRPSAPVFGSHLERMLWRDAVDYLPGDILCKVDRAAMANSLETRAPMLDARIAAFAWRAPDSMKIHGSETKWLLRQVLDRYVPRRLIDRPKMGFSVPLHGWLTGDLREWAQSLLDPAVIARQGMLNAAVIAKVWRRYLAGDSSADHQVWSLLMFQSWMAARRR